MELDAVASITGKKKSSLVLFFNFSSAEFDGTASDEYVRKERCVLMFYLSILTLITFQSKLSAFYYPILTVSSLRIQCKQKLN